MHDLIDLHTHTSESDGTLSPIALLELAHVIGLKALAITDHDTLSGYDEAARTLVRQRCELELVCGIEISTRCKNRSVHLLAYFLREAPTQAFRKWVDTLRAGRQDRNQSLVGKLQAMGFEITMEEVNQRGKNLPGRPHFASILVEKHYVTSIQEAFDRYLDESGSCYVPRAEPLLEEAVEQITAAGGLPALAHPVRISQDPQVVEEFVRGAREVGVRAIEVYHSDHCPTDVSLYRSLAHRFSLIVVGGSDFHGETKPNIQLGTGRGRNVQIEFSVLEDMRLRA